MVVCPKPAICGEGCVRAREVKAIGLTIMVIPLVCVPISHAQSQASEWQARVRKYAKAKDWDSAMRIVEQQIARAPQDMDVRAWKTGETAFVRGLEFSYTQHWYWYQSARILALTGTTLVYLSQNWTFTLGTTGSRSAFSGTNAEWRPSGIARLGFPLAHWGDKRLSGNVSFAAGTENFAIVDQIGSFASQTYGGGLRLQITDRQDLTGFAGYQKRPQNRTATRFGLSYGIHF